MPVNPEFDVLIAGGGMVGSTLACALAGSALRIGVVEGTPLEAAGVPRADHRVLALSAGSRRVLEGIGLWRAVSGAATPIDEIHVSDRGRFGCLRLRAADHGVPALGHVVTAGLLGAALAEALSQCSGVTVLRPARVRDVHLADAAAEVAVEVAGAVRTLRARLLVAADGARSRVRSAVGMGVREHDFGQVAVVASVTVDRPRRGRAFERFTPSGPLALLPLGGARYGLIWTVPEAAAEQLAALPEREFSTRLGAAFGTRLGRFSGIGERRCFPLFLVSSRERVRARLAMVGNAANTLHPIAGQGLNLGLRDVAALAEVVSETVESGGDPGALPALKRFAAWRRADQVGALLFTSGLVKVFCSRLAPLVWARNAGLVALDRLPAFKHAVGRRAMGLSGRQPRLARGLALSWHG